jgi:hypothetical protein
MARVRTASAWTTLLNETQIAHEPSPTDPQIELWVDLDASPPGTEIFASTITLAAGVFATTESIIGNAIVVPNIAYPYRIRYWLVENYQLAGAGTVDQHVRYNTTGAAAAVGDTLHRSVRMSLAAANQQSIVSVGAIDRASGPTNLSPWALTSGPNATVVADATLGQFMVWAVAT